MSDLFTVCAGDHPDADLSGSQMSPSVFYSVLKTTSSTTNKEKSCSVQCSGGYHIVEVVPLSEIKTCNDLSTREESACYPECVCVHGLIAQGGGGEGGGEKLFSDILTEAHRSSPASLSPPQRRKKWC